MWEEIRKAVEPGKLKKEGVLRKKEGNPLCQISLKAQISSEIKGPIDFNWQGF